MWKGARSKPPSSNAYREVLSCQTATDAMASGIQFRQCPPQTSFHDLLTTTSPLLNSVQTPCAIPSSPAPNKQQQMHLLQPIGCSLRSPEHTFHPNTTKNTYGTGSSLSGGSGNNQSTAESSLPTQSSAVMGWNNGFFLHNSVTPTMQMTNMERPSLSGSSEAGGLVTPDFEARRANVALPPGLLAREGFLPTDHFNTTSLALFRSATPAHNETCSLVTPYAQLQLSLSFNQYDTPEQIFTSEDKDANGITSAAGSPSLDGFGSVRNHQASSNPTTNSSLLHSYCEHGGTSGDFHGGI